MLREQRQRRQDKENALQQRTTDPYLVADDCSESSDDMPIGIWLERRVAVQQPLENDAAYFEVHPELFEENAVEGPASISSLNAGRSLSKRGKYEGFRANK